jgi:23S rRNA pseudouridine955/2504/2580 synthase
MKEIVITPAESNQRVDKYVRKLLSEAPLSFIYKLFRQKDVKINGHWVDISAIIKAGDVIRVYVSDAQLADFHQPRPIEDLKFTHEVIFEDDFILIVSKPKGLLVHGDEGEMRLTLANEVLNYLYKKGAYDPQAVGFVPAPAHRLDRNTSGLVVFGKSLPALQALEALFKDKTELKKEYLALVVGTLDKDGKIDLPLRKDPESGIVSVGNISKGANSALTFYHVEENLGPYTLLKVNIVTGRTHQIRVHMQAIGHPVVADGKYGAFEANRTFKAIYKYDDQFLHAYSLTFGHVTGLLSYLSGKIFVAPLPEKEQKILADLRKKI